MTILGTGTTTRTRGTLQPEPPLFGAVKCEVCGCRWVPDAEQFGCPGCALREILDAAQNKRVAK